MERIPPQNIEAERSTLGSMLLEREAVFKAQEILRAEDFYREAHRIIWNTITALVDRGEPVDLVTVTEYLRSRGQLEQIGGTGYLTGLVNSVPTAANVEYYARIVEEKSILRSVITAATEIAAAGYDETRDALSVLDEAEQRIFAIAQRRKNQGVTPLRSVLIPAFERIEKMHESKGGITGVPTGFPDFDRLTAGLQPSDLIILAARPSIGKTTFALNIAQRASIDYRIPVVVFSLEMSKEQLALKLLCAEAGVDMQRLRSGRLSEDDWPRLSRALGVLSEANMFIDDTPNLTAMEVRAKARRIKAEHGLGLIVIDYLQLMQGRGRVENRQQEVSEISRSLKALARELSVPVLALSQLSRAVEQRTSKVPTLADLRESGSLEQDADIVAFLYREDYYNPETEMPNVTELIIAKHRNGPLGRVRFYFRKECSTFESLADESLGGP
ncbi:MAG: replicative DNA helicase [Firmicutes bacterium]|nr:replicative DNA helicase [Bacillota bacterium]